jgi:hypothetical protein
MSRPRRRGKRSQETRAWRANRTSQHPPAAPTIRNAATRNAATRNAATNDRVQHERNSRPMNRIKPFLLAILLALPLSIHASVICEAGPANGGVHSGCHGQGNCDDGRSHSIPMCACCNVTACATTARCSLEFRIAGSSYPVWPINSAPRLSVVSAALPPEKSTIPNLCLGAPARTGPALFLRFRSLLI